MDAAVASGEVGVGGHEARSRVFAAVGAERDGPVAQRLLAFTVDRRPAVRQRVFELLGALCYPDIVWAGAAQAAECGLDDSDEPVRRAAAWLLVTAGGLDRAIAALDTTTDPVVRVALVEAMEFAAMLRRDGEPWLRVVVRLRDDEVPAVRLVANVAALRVADSGDWAALDAAIRSDLDAAGGVLGAPGSRSSLTAGKRWASVLARLDREPDCCVWARRLAGPAEPMTTRLDGVEFAVAAMRTWRAAPAELAPVLAGMLAEGPSVVRSAAARALAASLTATRLAADRLVELLDDPDLGSAVATALGSVGDHRAVPHLIRLMGTGDDVPRLGEALVACARAGADPTGMVAATRRVLATHHGPCRSGGTWRSCPAAPALRLLAELGPAAVDAVPDLVARIQAVMDRNDLGEPLCEIHVLERVGQGAGAAVPLLRRYAKIGNSGADLAVRALVMITSDRVVADRFLAERPEQLRRCRIASVLLGWLTDHGGLTGRQHRQLRHLFARPGATRVGAAGALWRCEGPSVAGELLDTLVEYLDDDLYGPEVLRVFTAMGEYARPILGRLDRFVLASKRVGVCLGDADAEMRADERLLAAVMDARDRIAG